MIVQEVIHETLHAVPFVCGPIANNTYVVYDENTRDCVIIDPSYYFQRVLSRVSEMGLTPREYWLTHGHFDHYLGTAYPESLALGVSSHLHPLDEPIFEESLNPRMSGISFIGNAPRPMLDLSDGKELQVGDYTFKIMLTPGHAPGHCCFYCEEAGWLFSGDLVFYHSYGRTDLTGGSTAVLMKSIREKVLTLPADTLIMPGHEDFTFVKDEAVFY